MFSTHFHVSYLSVVLTSRTLPLCSLGIVITSILNSVCGRMLAPFHLVLSVFPVLFFHLGYVSLSTDFGGLTMLLSMC